MVAAHEHFDVNVVCFLYDWFHTKTTKFQLIGIYDKRPCHGSGSYSPERPRFDPRPLCVGYVVDKVALGTGFTPSTSDFTCYHHSTDAPC